MKTTRIALMLALAVAGLSQTASAAVVHNEGVSGDLPNSFGAPKSLAFSLGSNDILGTHTRVVLPSGANGPVDRDFFTFTIPVGTSLTGITILPGTTFLSNDPPPVIPVAFLGLASGTGLTMAVPGGNAPLADQQAFAATILGFSHYAASDIGNNILADIGDRNSVLGNPDPTIGFTAPLGAGTYTAWTQETAIGTTTYGIRFTLVPEPGSFGMLGAGLIGLFFAGGAKRRKLAA